MGARRLGRQTQSLIAGPELDEADQPRWPGEDAGRSDRSDEWLQMSA